MAALAAQPGYSAIDLLGIVEVALTAIQICQAVQSIGYVYMHGSEGTFQGRQRLEIKGFCLPVFALLT